MIEKNKRKVAINIYDLEKFYLDEINRQLFTCLSLAEAWDKFGHKNGWTTAEVFAERLREEAQGKKFRYSIKGCIIPTQDKYLSLFQSARSKAWGNYIATYLYDF